MDLSVSSDNLKMSNVSGFVPPAGSGEGERGVREGKVDRLGANNEQYFLSLSFIKSGGTT